MADDAHQLAKPADEPVLTFAEACEHLTSPYAQEDYSAATGQPWLSVDLTSAGDAPANLEALREALGRFVCPTLAVVPDPSTPAARAIASAFDVVVETRAELQPLVAAAKRTPIAAAALVQLLRANEHRTIEEALVAESFVYSTLQSGPEFARWLAQQPTLRPVIPEEPPVLVERTGPRLDIVLNHPARRNAYSAAMRDHLCEALQLALADDSITEIVLRGNGPNFCAGGDLDEFGLLPDPATAHAIRTTRSAARLLAACAPRLRAELHGACIGAGIELPAWAAHITATDDAWFQLPELAMGLVPGAGGTVSVPRRVGFQRASWLALTGARIGRDMAFDWRLAETAA
jgi:enoyl-CoA hydratase/carnithine racemase